MRTRDGGGGGGLAGRGALDGPAASAVLAAVVSQAAQEAFGAPPARRVRALDSARVWRRDSPWFACCRCTHFNLQDALYRALDPDAARRWRNAFNAQKRREQRRLRARGNAALLKDLRHNPQRFWSDFKADSEAAPGGLSPAEICAHWRRQFSGFGRGSLPELAATLGAATPRELTAGLAAEAAASTSAAGPEAAARLQAAAALNAPIQQSERSGDPAAALPHRGGCGPGQHRR